MTTAFATPHQRSAPQESTPQESAPRSSTAPLRVTGRPGPLRVIEGGRSPMARHRRRQVLAHRLVVAVGLVAAVLVFNALLAVGGPAPTDTPGAAAADQITESSYTVRPGDTLWEIAQRTGADGDVRDAVAELAEVNGGDVVQVGQVLTIPADLRR